MSEKDKRLRYKYSVTLTKGLNQLDVNMDNSKLIIELLTNLTVTYRWYRYLRIPVNGDGNIGANTKTTPSGNFFW